MYGNFSHDGWGPDSGLRVSIIEMEVTCGITEIIGTVRRQHCERDCSKPWQARALSSSETSESVWVPSFSLCCTLTSWSHSDRLIFTGGNRLTSEVMDNLEICLFPT